MSNYASPVLQNCQRQSGEVLLHSSHFTLTGSLIHMKDARCFCGYCTNLLRLLSTTNYIGTVGLLR